MSRLAKNQGLENYNNLIMVLIDFLLESTGGLEK